MDFYARTLLITTYFPQISFSLVPSTQLDAITLAPRKLTIIIEKTKDMCSTNSDNMKGIYGGGNTIEDATESINNSLKLYQKHNNLKPQDYEITYKIITNGHQ